MLIDILLDAVIDSIRLVPFLFVVYLLIAYLEQHRENKLYQQLTKSKVTGPIIGALLGCLPQCGFSVVGANLYSKRMITMGALLAIFISTSDEAVPILLANPKLMPMVLIVLIIKVIFAIIVGLIVDICMKQNVKASDEEMTQSVVSESYHCSCCGHEHDHESIIVYSLKHTLKIFLFIFVINLILGGIIEGFGEETLKTVLLGDHILQPALAAVIGLIPNCASSIILTEMFVTGALSFGALMAGLCTGAGIGLVVLFKVNKNKMDNLKIVGILYVTGTLLGMLIQLIG